MNSGTTVASLFRLHVMTDFIALPRDFTGISSFACILSWNWWNMWSHCCATTPVWKYTRPSLSVGSKVKLNISCGERGPGYIRTRQGSRHIIALLYVGAHAHKVCMKGGLGACSQENFCLLRSFWCNLGCKQRFCVLPAHGSRLEIHKLTYHRVGRLYM